MSEVINNGRIRIDELKNLILDLHKGKTIDETRAKLKDALGTVPYDDVVRAEEELIKEGLDREEVLKFCDLHTEALKGNIDLSFAKKIPEGHPVDIFIKENNEIRSVTDNIKHIFYENSVRDPHFDSSDLLLKLHGEFNALMDIEKHYLRKENLLFPFMEKHNITGPPMVMWGKHDETRALLKSAFQLFDTKETTNAETVGGFIEFIFAPSLKAIEEMIYKEEKILFPMCMDTLMEDEWYQIYKQSDEIGYCLYSPEKSWLSQSAQELNKTSTDNTIKFENGYLKPEELEAVFNSLPLDITFVDKDDKVKFFSHGVDRIFHRPKAVLGRQVQYCHPPSSVHVVNQILDDFKSGKQDSAKFWINLHGKFVHISYFAVRDKDKNYLGTLELTHDISEYRNIEDERRILQYEK